MKRKLSGYLPFLILLFLSIQINYSVFAQTSVCVNGTTKLNSSLPSGGTMSYINGYTIHTFNSSDQLIVPANFSATAELLIVAGGGGGGYRHAGGGGAGGLIHSLSYLLNSSQNAVVGIGGVAYVGNGGATYDPLITTHGNMGGQSSFGGSVAIGGGGGGNNGQPGQTGGSGGGGANGTLGGFGISGQGKKGGDQNYGLGCCQAWGAGGGGYFAAANNTASGQGSNGGVGGSFNISGSMVNYADGGGGGNWTTNIIYTGGNGSGGSGGNAADMVGKDGMVNTGGGGGGGGATVFTSGNGGSGGSGVVIIKYLTPTITWSSSNPAVATVDNTGLVTGISAGTANITKTITSGSQNNTYNTTITVNAPPQPTILASGPTTLCAGGSVTLTASGSSLGNALTLASGDYVNIIPSTKVSNLGASGFTLEAWIKPTDVYGEAKSIIRKTGDYNLYIYQGSIAAEVWPIAGTDNTWKKLIGSAANILPNVWTHVAATWDKTNLKLYINGVEISGTLTDGSIYDNNEDLRIGTSQKYGNPFAGNIDELRIWNTPRTLTQISDNRFSFINPATAGIVAYYKFDEGTGTTTNDAANIGNSGTLTNGASWLVPSTVPISFSNYLWSPGGQTTQNITVNTTGNYSVTVTNPQGCTATSAVTAVTVLSNLETVQNFVLYSGIGTVSNTGSSIVTGDVGSNLGAVSGFDAPSTLNGGIFSGTPYTTQTKKDLLKLYIHLSDIPVTETAHTAVFGGGEAIKAGVYTIPGAGSMAGNLNLDANDKANAVFIIKFEGAFSPAASSSITLLHGAKASNVYWIAEGAISIGASAVMKGTFIAHTGAVSMAAGGNLEGRLLSTVGAVSFGPGTAILPSTAGYLPDLAVSSCNNEYLNSAGNFTLFTSAGAVSNIGSSGIIGNVGSNAGAITGFETSATTLMGNTNNADIVTGTAASDLLAGYTQLVNTTATNSAHAPAFGNETLAPGVYAIGGAGSLAGTLILDGTGVTNPTFIFKFGGAFSVGAQSKIILINVSHCNVYWIAEGAISIGALSFMKGSFIANNGANTMDANGNLEGSLFSTTGAIGFNTGVGYISYLNCVNTVNPGLGNRQLKSFNKVILKSDASAENKLSVYPNPAKGIITLAVTGDANKVTSIEVVNTLGKVIYSSKHYQANINLSGHAAGIYFVRVLMNSAIITTKVVMEK